MHQEDIRNTNHKSIYIEQKNNEYSNLSDENSESNNLSNDRNQVASPEEHTQHSQHSPPSSNNFIEEENKKNIFRKGTTDNWACKECKVKGDKWFMKQHQCKGVLKKQQKAINP